MKIPLSDVILENRYQKVTHATPPVESKLMGLMRVAMGNSTLWNQLMRVVFMGRILGGFNQTIESLPLFMSGWSEGRDTAVPPKQTFRQWFESNEAKNLLAEARENGVPVQKKAGDAKLGDAEPDAAAGQESTPGAGENHDSEEDN